ncbi:MAG TPA: 50S ribosomal protein L10 [Anaerohalosphaeraceae bacterium]|nr:50S ribosomal protein L10 [Anaerohalosphaeraceae bacterium]
MSYFIKNLIQSEYEKKFKDVREFVVIDSTGINGIDNNILRGELLKKGIRMAVVKNSLMRLTLDKMQMASASALFKSGPCTVVYGGDSVVDVAKEIVEWTKKSTFIKPKGAYVDGMVVKDLAKMPTRAELQAQVVQLVLSPGARVAGAVCGAGSMIAGCIKTLIEKREKEAA